MSQRALSQTDSGGAAGPVAGGLLQRKCACGTHTIGGAPCDKCGGESTLQRSPNGRAADEGVPRAVHEAMRTTGRPLGAGVRSFMESRLGGDFSRVPVGTQSKLVVGQAGDRYEQEADRLAEGAVSEPAPASRRDTPRAEASGGRDSAAGGADFGRVRVHADSAADVAARSVGARAFTLGRDIFFARGEYDPHSAGGRRLLAHELAHVGQQGGDSSVIQRAITVQNPGAQTPHAPPPWATMTNAEMVQRWLNTLCPEGSWTVDGATGVAASSIAGTFCAPQTQAPYNHHTLSSHPTSCGCLCELTAAGSRDIRIHAADSFAVGATNVNVTAQGEGATLYPHAGHPEYNVGVSGVESRGVTGVGDTAPLAGANPT
ncbi:MAG TPA: DUF4157 domain-containing protein, partial [Pyrinomonadaceae bacterium]